jgi:hypothetical protein
VPDVVIATIASLSAQPFSLPGFRCTGHAKCNPLFFNDCLAALELNGVVCAE